MWRGYPPAYLVGRLLLTVYGWADFYFIDADRCIEFLFYRDMKVKPMQNQISEINSEKEQKKNNIRLTIVVVTIIAIIAAVLSFLILLFMKNDARSDKTNFTAHEITQYIIAKMDYDNLSEISTDNISKYYEIPDGIIYDSSMYLSSRPDNFTEIACFTLRSEDKESELLKVIDDYIKEKSATYQNVNEKAYYAINNSAVLTHYPYVLVSVSSDNNAVENAFNTMFSDEKTITTQ